MHTARRSPRWFRVDLSRAPYGSVGDRRGKQLSKTGRLALDLRMAPTHSRAPAIPPALLADLRQGLASAIADEKSYNVPALCIRLGLASGEVEDVHRSKFRYAQQRLIGEPAATVLNAAREFLSQRSDYALSEVVAKIDELPGRQVTALTRRRLMALFDGGPLSTELDQLDLLRKVWPLSAMPAGTDYGSGTMEDRLFQHTVRNDDMSNREVLDVLGVLTCSRARLFTYLEAVTGPEAQMLARQAELASQIDALLVQDGYRLVEAGKMSGSPVYAVRIAPKGSPADAPIAESLSRFDPEEIGAGWQAAMDSREASPRRAITLARTLLEDAASGSLLRPARPIGKPTTCQCSTGSSPSCCGWPRTTTPSRSSSRS